MVVYQHTGTDTTGSSVFNTNGMIYITNANAGSATSTTSLATNWSSNSLNVYRRVYYQQSTPWGSATGATEGTGTNTHLWIADDNATGGWTVADPGINDNWITISNWNKSRKEQFRDKIRDQLLPLLRNHEGRELRAVLNPIEAEKLENAEIVALSLLKTMLTREQWRTYLRSGIVTVWGSSGFQYIVARGGHTVRVLTPRGAPKASLCVHMANHKLPPSDEVIARLVLINCDEPEIWKRANVSFRDSVGGYERHGYPWTTEILRTMITGQKPPPRSLLAAA